LHRRFFDGRMVTVQYIPLNLYRARFTKWAFQSER
jgi:hypothetical protein